MSLDTLTEENYRLIKQAPRAVIIVSKSNCSGCKTYKPVIISIANEMPYIKFAEAILDSKTTSLYQFKKDHAGDMPYWQGLPITLLIKNGREIFKIDGPKQYSDIHKIIISKLVVGSQVYLSKDNRLVPATIRQIVNGKYFLQTQQNEIIESSQEQFKWNL
ncbi:MAG: thioredoxin family protein [Candidatus Pacearchaeota archaeon]